MNNFLREYIDSLKEDGELDWVIANIGIAKGWSVLRLPFGRADNGEIKLKKGEPEFGIDLSFFADVDHKELVIVVLKDERLTSGTWKKQNIQSDLLDAMSVPLGTKPFQNVSQICLIFAHNKDENRGGQEAYERFTGQNRFNETRADGTRIPVSHERWNLERICKEVENYVFTADILPRQLSAGLHYLCSQIRDFHFGTTNWEKITQPTWLQQLKSILQVEKPDRVVLTVNFCLSLIKHEFDLKNKSERISPGYIDHYEIALLAVAKRFEGKIEQYKQTYIGYCSVLNNYFQENRQVFRCPDAFDRASFMGLTAIRSSHLAFWNIGRLALFIELIRERKAGQMKLGSDPNNDIEISEWVDLLVTSLGNNDAIFRPLVDLHHVELFLIWKAMLLAGKVDDIYSWLMQLKAFLAARRSPDQVWRLPFIESYSRMDLVAEFAVTQVRPDGFRDETSYLVMMLIELCFGLPPKQQQEMVLEIVSSVVMPSSKRNSNQEAIPPLKLVSWVPTTNWKTEILGGGMARGGTLQIMGPNGNNAEEVATDLMETMQNWRLNEEDGVFGESLAMQILGCIRYRSPLPPEFWRREVVNLQLQYVGR